MRRDKGLRKVCCEVPVDLMTAGVAGAAAAATLLNALVDGNIVGSSFSPHTITPLHDFPIDRLIIGEHST
jgi:hypothetical protein